MANKADLHQFLVDTAQIFPVQATRDKNRLWDLASNYLWARIYKKEINYDKALSWLIDNLKKNSYFPDITTIAESLKYGEVKPICESCADEGSLLVVTLPNGYTYHFTVSSTGKPMSEVKSGLEQKFGQCTYKIYPKGTLIIGEQRWEPD